MKIEIENWSEKNLTDNAKILMKESVSCYKIGSYRSAYIMSYLAFKQTIRERIITSPTYPECYANSIEWDISVVNLLKSDDKWEDTINDIIEANPRKETGKKYASIFKFTNRERTLMRYGYWKDIRNSCAHAKEAHIDSATVEQFWNYIKDDLSQFYVLGGKAYLMNELIECHRYYDCDEKDISHLLKDVEIVYKRELKGFFEEFLDSLIKVSRNLINSENLKFWEQIIFNKEDVIKEAFALSICEKQDIFLQFYNYFHDILKLAISCNKRFIQDYINPLLCEELSEKYLYKKYFWKMLCGSLIEHPKGIDIESITSNYNNFILIKDIDINEYEKSLLNKYKVFNKFILNAGKDVFRNDSSSHWDYYSYGNIKDDSYISKCFDYIELDVEMIEKIEWGYEELKDNVEMRSNLDSRINGNTRIELYKQIILKNKNNIKKVCGDTLLEKYPNINNIIS